MLKESDNMLESRGFMLQDSKYTDMRNPANVQAILVNSFQAKDRVRNNNPQLCCGSATLNMWISFKSYATFR